MAKKYIDADRLRKELDKRLKNVRDYMNGAGMRYKGPKYYKAQGKESVYDALLNILTSLQQELDSRSIPVLRADTTEKQDRILKIIGQDEIYCHFPLDSGKETDCGYEDYNDRVYIDGKLTFNKMAEIVDFLSKNSK